MIEIRNTKVTYHLHLILILRKWDYGMGSFQFSASFSRLDHFWTGENNEKSPELLHKMNFTVLKP